MKDKKTESLTPRKIRLVYYISKFLGWFLHLGEKLGKVTVLHRERLNEDDLRQAVLVCNHPSWGDPFFVWYVLRQFCSNIADAVKNAPLIVADRKQFYNHWFIRIFRPVMIPVDRGDPKKEALSFRRILEYFQEHERPGILFAEGGRTSSGNYDEIMYSPNGEKIRRLKEGVGLLVKQLKGRKIIPIAIKGSEQVCPNDHNPDKKSRRLFTRFVFWSKVAKVTINIGEPIVFDATSTRGEIAFKVGREILALMDEIKQAHN